MPPRKRGSDGNAAKSNGKDRPFTWINYDLSSKDKEWLSSADVASEFPAGMEYDLVVEGYKFSISLDARNSCFIASITDKDDKSPYYNHCLSGRGSTPAHARTSVLYRHVVLAQGDWSFFSQPQRKGDEIYG